MHYHKLITDILSTVEIAEKFAMPPCLIYNIIYGGKNFQKRGGTVTFSQFNKLGENFSFLHCHVAWRICGWQGGSGEIQKGDDRGQQLSLDLACKYYREDV